MKGPDHKRRRVAGLSARRGRVQVQQAQGHPVGPAEAVLVGIFAAAGALATVLAVVVVAVGTYLSHRFVERSRATVATARV